jgi:NitT/TauT family transport system substrate-binding protein
MLKQGLYALIGAAMLGSFAVVPTAGAQTKLNVGYVPVSDFLPLMVAQDKQIFAKHGLEITATKIMLASNVPAALVSESIDIGMGTGTMLLQTADSGLDLVAICGVSRFTKENPILSLVARKGVKIESAADFKGKKIGVPGFNSVIDVTVRKWLLDRGVTPETVAFSEAPFPQMHDLLANSTLDAVAVLEPFRARIINDGAGVKVSDYFAELNPDASAAFWTARSDWASKHAAAIGAFHDALAEAIAYIDQNPDDAKAIEVKSFGFASPIRPSYSLAIMRSDLEFYATVAKQLGMLRQPVDLVKLVPEERR